jgi:dTDP-glucose pyrophosphorylase
MSGFRDSLVRESAPISDALRALDATQSKIALVVDGEQRLLGTITDGDVRRGILRGIGPSEPVAKIMNRRPVTAPVGTQRSVLIQIMQAGDYKQIPIVDSARRVVALEWLDHLLEPPDRENRVVLMAGGFGRRLLPLTQDSAKPMLNVGGRPILETILRSFTRYGLRRFIMAVHYRADEIMEHFGDGADFGVEIRYVREKEPLGTAGALRELPEPPNEPLLVMNGDILTRVNFDQLLDFHTEHGSAATLCVRDYDFQVPYGVVEVDEHRLARIDEKPIQRFFVNAGIYVLEPRVLERIPAEGPFDMPQLLERVREAQEVVSVFPIREYWIDVGRHDDLDRAHEDFLRVFEV